MTTVTTTMDEKTRWVRGCKQAACSTVPSSFGKGRTTCPIYPDQLTATTVAPLWHHPQSDRAGTSQNEWTTLSYFASNEHSGDVVVHSTGFTVVLCDDELDNSRIDTLHLGCTAQFSEGFLDVATGTVNLCGNLSLTLFMSG